MQLNVNTIVVIVVLMALEGVALYFIMPNREWKDVGPNSGVVVEADLFEQELGVFKVIKLRPGEPSLKISFTCVGTIEKKYKDDFMDRLEKKRNRVKEGVAKVVREAPDADIYSASLAMLKHKILKEANSKIGDGSALIKEIILNDFEPVEF